MPADDISPFRRIRRRFYWLLVMLLLGMAEMLPLAAGRIFCRKLARVGLLVRRRDRELALTNLGLAFPGMDYRGRIRLLGEAAEALGRNLFDTLAAKRVLGRPGAVVEAPRDDGNGQAVGEVLCDLAGGNRGVLVLTGHLGCWELLGGWLAGEVERRGLGSLAVVTGTIHNPAVDRLLQERRRRLGLNVMPRDEGVRPLLRHLQSGGVAAVLLDQNLGGRGLEVPFFGRPAPTPSGLPKIVLRLGTPVVPVAIGWNPDRSRHEVVHLPPLASGNPPGDEEPEMALLTAANAALEELIRRNPPEWVWFHDRWGLNSKPDTTATRRPAS